MGSVALGLNPDSHNLSINIVNVRPIALVLAHNQVFDLADSVVHVVISLHCNVDQDHIKQRDSCTDNFLVLNMSGTNCIQSVINNTLQRNEVLTQ